MRKLLFNEMFMTFVLVLYASVILWVKRWKSEAI